MFDIFYNGVSGISIGAYPDHRPEIPAPILRIERQTIPGRDGDLYISDGAYDDIIIPVQFNFKNSDESRWYAVYNDVKRWILSSKSGMLVFSDNQSKFWNVKYAVIRENLREAIYFGSVNVEFYCDPYTYYKAGLVEIGGGIMKNNSWVSAKPIYKISGEGMATLTVNEKAMVCNVGQDLTIDTEREIAYNSDGVNQNTAVSGEYENLILQPGNNQVDITDGFILRVIPRWRTL